MGILHLLSEHHEGKITDERAYPNFAVRWKYLDTALKLQGMYDTEKHGKIDASNEGHFAEWTDEKLLHYATTGERPKRFDEDESRYGR